MFVYKHASGITMSAIFFHPDKKHAAREAPARANFGWLPSRNFPTTFTRTLFVSVNYTGAADPRIDRRDFRAKVWTDSATLPQIDGKFSDEESFWETINLESSTSGSVQIPLDAQHVFVSVYDNRPADSDGESKPVAVQVLG